MMNNNDQNLLYNQDNNANRRRIIPQDRQKINNNVNVKYGPIPNPNSNLNNRNNNMNNQNRIENIRSNTAGNEVEKALLIIQRELRKKNNRISELERKVQELTRKLNSLTNNNNFSLSKNSPMMTPSKENNINMNNNIYESGYNNLNVNINNMRNNNIRNIIQKRAFPMNNLNYNSDSENIVKRNLGYDNLSHSNDNSVLTYNGIHTSSKKDVKEYLKEVKAKIESKKFKEFIRNIKLLTSKNEIAQNKEDIIESMRILFGKEHLDLFLRFEKIIGAGK
jgi:hypothetical protein